MAAGASADRPLGRLRDDLEIAPGAPFLSGAPAWVIRDPVRHRFYQIGQRSIDVLSRWSAGSTERLKERLFREKGLRLQDEELEALIRFLTQNELLEGGGAGTAARFAETARRQAGPNLWPRAQKLLFFRVPLVRPEPFLHATWPFVRPLFSRGFVWFSLVVLCLALYLASRQTAEIEAHVRNAFTWAGAALFLVAIAGIKVLHELGHAYLAIRRGLRVPVMGVGFFVFLPLLYTDITDAWRLRRRSDRVLIDLGGIMVELAVAIYATLLWCFLPDGAMRSLAFAVATSGWVLSLMVNLNPFLRFDGYYLLSDSFGIQNLQPRAIALGKWAMRRALWGLDDPPPEALSPRTRAWMVAYAYGVWAYRLFLFVTIAVLVYAMFFKLAGLVMLAIVLTSFVLRPLVAELRHWLREARRIRRSPRALVTLGLFGALVALLFWPIPTRVTIPAVLEAERQQAVFPPEAARLDRILAREGEAVTAGQPLFEFSVPELPTRIAQSRKRIEMHEARRLSGAGDAAERAEGTVIARMLDEERQTLAALTERRARLVLRATIDGTLREVSPDLDEGAWYARTDFLGRVIAPGAPILRGFVSEADLRRLDRSGAAVFVADEVTIPRIELGPLEIAGVAIDRLPDGYLARPNGGVIAVASAAPDDLLVAGVWFPVTARPLDASAADLADDDWSLRGMILSRSLPQSYASRIGNRVARVLFREFGF